MLVLNTFQMVTVLLFHLMLSPLHITLPQVLLLILLLNVKLLYKVVLGMHMSLILVNVKIVLLILHLVLGLVVLLPVKYVENNMD